MERITRRARHVGSVRGLEGAAALGCRRAARAGRAACAARAVARAGRAAGRATAHQRPHLHGPHVRAGHVTRTA